MPLGSALDWNELAADPRLSATFLREFDQMTAENEMKMFALQPGPGRFDFRVADAMVNWALARGKRVRGHTLVWGNQLPGWVESGSWTREELLAVMKDHIETVMGHFRGRVPEWDVVNEALEGDGTFTNNIWFRTIGPDYIEQAFRFARQADPKAKLFYNDNGIDMPDHPHTVATRALLSALLAGGAPIDGVGLQNHVSNTWYSPRPSFAEALRQFAALGLDVAVTEMDVRTDGGGTRAAELQAQARVYEGYARACREEPRCTSFTTWGISDRYSWFENPALAPLMFDADLRPKPAFYPVEDWIKKP